MFETYARESLEDRLLRFLASVPVSTVARELARVAPGCSPRDMTGAEVVKVLGVAGIAGLAGVRRSTVLESAGPESCAIADLIEQNPYGNYENPGGASCWPCSQAYGPSVGGTRPAPSPWNGRGYSDPGARPYAGDPGYYAEATPLERTRVPSTPLERTYTAPTYAAPSGGLPAGTYTDPRVQLAGQHYDYQTGAGATYTAPVQQLRAPRLPTSLSYRRNQEEFPLEIKGTAPPSGFTGWPGAVPFRRDAWNFSESWYILQSGDTFSGLAATYLGHPSRYLEIWQLQPYRYTKAIDPLSVKPDRPLVQIGERVIMPAEALARAKELVTTGAPSAPAIGGVGGSPKGAGAPWSTGTKIAIGVAALGALGVGAYALT